MMFVPVIEFENSGITFRELKNLESLSGWSENRVRQFIDEMMEAGSIELKNGKLVNVPYDHRKEG